jgi:hypothetical protein
MWYESNNTDCRKPHNAVVTISERGEGCEAPDKGAHEAQAPKSSVEKSETALLSKDTKYMTGEMTHARKEADEKNFWWCVETMHRHCPANSNLCRHHV